MKDYKEWFKRFEDYKFVGTYYECTQSTDIEGMYQAFIARATAEGYMLPKDERWVRPEIEDIKNYFHEKISGHTIQAVQEINLMADGFYNHWDSLDWMWRKTRIKSWKGRAATWIKNNEKYKRNDSKGARKLSVTEQVREGIEARAGDNTTLAEELGPIVADYDLNVRS